MFDIIVRYCHFRRYGLNLFVYIKSSEFVRLLYYYPALSYATILSEFVTADTMICICTFCCFISNIVFVLSLRPILCLYRFSANFVSNRYLIQFRSSYSHPLLHLLLLYPFLCLPFSRPISFLNLTLTQNCFRFVASSDFVFAFFLGQFRLKSISYPISSNSARRLSV